LLGGKGGYRNGGLGNSPLLPEGVGEKKKVSLQDEALSASQLQTTPKKGGGEQGKGKREGRTHSRPSRLPNFRNVAGGKKKKKRTTGTKRKKRKKGAPRRGVPTLSRGSPGGCRQTKKRETNGRSLLPSFRRDWGKKGKRLKGGKTEIEKKKKKGGNRPPSQLLLPSLYRRTARPQKQRAGEEGEGGGGTHLPYFYFSLRHPRESTREETPPVIVYDEPKG